MIQGIEHTGIASSDPTKLAHWYVEHLDFIVNYTSSKSRNCFLKAPDGTMIEIIEANDGPQPLPDRAAPGLRHLAIAVTDFDAAYLRLKNKGVNFLAGPATSGGVTTAFFTDCDGNILHLLKRETPLP
jgi:glyoxylase I family protein